MRWSPLRIPSPGILAQPTSPTHRRVLFSAQEWSIYRPVGFNQERMYEHYYLIGLSELISFPLSD
jgi:hypothetical protein